MSSSAKSLLLEEEINLLVKHFGVQRVRAALEKVSIEDNERQRTPTPKLVPRLQKPLRATIADDLESIRERVPEKYRLLSEFHNRLKDRQILRETQDIRHFAQFIGLK